MLFLHSALFRFMRKVSTIFLAFFFVLGFLFGIYTFMQSEVSLASLMRGSVVSAVSIVDFLACALLPFLLSCIVVTRGKTGFLYLICFAEAFLYAYISMIVIYSFPAPAAFYRWFFLFGEAVSLPLLFFYWIQGLSKRASLSNAWTFFFLAAGCFISAVEYRILMSVCLI